MYRASAAAFLVASSILITGIALGASSKEEESLFAGCDWLERAIAREPERDDAFGMFMRGMRPKCQAMLEGIARKDNSVRPDAMRQIVKEIADLQSVIDAEHGGPPPTTTGPTPGDTARQKVAEEKAAQDKSAADKAAEERAAKEKAAQDKAAAEREAAERAAQEKAAEEAKKAAERDAKRDVVADKKAEAEAKRAAEREAKALAAAEKKAAEEAKKAAEDARKAAEREAKDRAAADKLAAEEAKRADEEARLAREAAERDEARKQAEALVNAEAEAEKRAAAERETENRAPIVPMPKPVAPKKGIDGTWEQPETKVLDRNVKRTLNLLTKDKKIQGELYEEVWFAAPSSWIDASCSGNDTFRMVTTARVNGEVDGGNVVLSRDPPRILTCTCSSRCTVETRRRGMDLVIAASGAELKDTTGVFVRPGMANTTKSDGPGESKVVLAPVDFAGNWETAPFKIRDRNVVQRIEIEVDAEGRVRGTFVERSTQGLPLASWSDRFCGGASKWEWVTQWRFDGKVAGRKAPVKAKDGENILCSCPAKCAPPKDRLVFDLVYGATGATVHVGDQVFERR